MSRLFLLLAMFIVSCSIQVSSAATLDKLKESWKLYMEECERNSSRDPPSTGLVCNRTFDNYACWPDGLLNTTVSVACPWYLPWYHKVQHGMVYQECDANGQWVTTKNTSECDSNDPSQQYYGHIRIMYTVGYSLSLVALVLALGILIFFRKLHCMRNNIHMNLFASFILRALSILIKDALLVSNITSQDLSGDQEQGFPQASMPPVELLVNNGTTVSCRIAVVMMQYSIMANSYWLLVEGIYLHNLLVITVFTERNYFKIYLCIGWGTPLIFLVPWVIAKYLYENQECWEQNINMNYWWIIRSPILLAVVINLLIFIHIIEILVSKLQAHQMRYTDYKFRLAKSTLTLIPLLGIHQVVFIFVTDESTKTTIGLRLTKLFIDLFLSSFQVGLLKEELEPECQLLLSLTNTTHHLSKQTQRQQSSLGEYLRSLQAGSESEREKEAYYLFAGRDVGDIVFVLKSHFKMIKWKTQCISHSQQTTEFFHLLSDLFRHLSISVFPFPLRQLRSAVFTNVSGGIT